MAILKCKMCGGDLSIAEGVSTAECEYCGSLQTVPKVDDEKKLTLFARAHRLRAACEFDKAAGIYETIVADFPTEAEAYWGLVLCRYGIEYVDDPASGKKIPTCHRSGFESVLKDSDFEQALENADPAAFRLYRDEAKVIEEIRKGIIAVSANEEPYDVFICYKETDEKGDRTLDSVLGQDLYDALAAKGYRVFFARISLEDKLGVEYEPYIFAALNSARIMLAIGTAYEYYNAVWVKNEWSRFLKLMAKDKDKHLIPCYKGIDAYDMPEEFAKLQAQDLNKMGAIQDILRGVEKLIARKVEPVRENAIVQQAANGTAPLLKRAFMFLEDGNWDAADEYCEKVLDQDPENARAYLGKLMAELRVKKQEALRDCQKPFDESDNYQKALRFGDEVFKEKLADYATYIKLNKTGRNSKGHSKRNVAVILAALVAILAVGFVIVLNTVILPGGKYDAAVALLESGSYEEAINAFAALDGYKDSVVRIEYCQEMILEGRYLEAVTLLETGSYTEAAAAFEVLGNYKDSIEKISLCNAQALETRYQEAVALLEAKNHAEAIAAFEALEGYGDSTEKILDCKYGIALALKEEGRWLEAIDAFDALGDFKDARDQSMAAWGKVSRRETITAGGSNLDFFTVAVKTDGTAVAVGNNLYGQCNVGDWTDLVAVSARSSYTVGLKKDGTVVVTGLNQEGRCDVNGWRDIVSVCTTNDHTVGLKKDGTVVAVGNNAYGQCDVGRWTDIVAIAAGDYFTVGLKRDGTVVAVGNNMQGQCDVGNWKDIVAISAAQHNTVGLKSDGTVVVSGSNRNGQRNVSHWTDIVCISIGSFWTYDSFLIGVKSDGTAVAVGSNYSGESDVGRWTDIVAVSAGAVYTLGLKADGTAVAVGDDYCGQCNVGGWSGLMIP